MSTPTDSSGAARLIAFLRVAGHTLDPARAAAISTSLPPDLKTAARQLRQQLLDVGIELKHTHALKAVSEAKGSGAHSSAGKPRWEVATWVVDAPAVSARRRRVSSIGQAAELVIERLREQADPGDCPLIQLLQGDYLQVNIVGQPCPGWRAVLVQTDTAGNVIPIDDAGRGRFAERVRRFVEGAPAGWVSGVLHPVAATVTYSLTIRGVTVDYPDEESFVRQLSNVLGPEFVDLNPRQIAIQAGLLQPMVKIGETNWQPLELDCLVKLTSRLQSLERSTSAGFAAWLDATYEEAYSTFGPEPLNGALVRAEMKRKALSNAQVAFGLGLSIPLWEEHLQRGYMPLSLFPKLASALGNVSADSLLGRPERPLARIPIRDVQSLSLFLGKFEHLSLEASVNVQSSRATQLTLHGVCAASYGRRRTWQKNSPDELQQLLDAARADGNTICVHMERRFVQDLPAGIERLAIALVLSTQLSRVVDQYAPDSEDTRLPIEDPIDEKWLARFNKPTFTGSDMLRYANVVSEMRDPEDDEKGHFETQTHAAVRVFKGDPHRAHAAQVRMEALARLMGRVNLEPWVQSSTEDGAQMFSRPVFEAIARCKIVAINGRAGFDPIEFQQEIVAHVATT